MKNKYIEIAAFLLMAATVTAGFLSTTDASLLPPEWRPYLPLVIGGVILLKQLAYGVLDLLDDGKLNKSYKAPTTLLKVLVILLLPLCLCQCASTSSTDEELRHAQAAIEAAQFTHSLAMIVYAPRLADSKTSATERAVAAQLIEESRKRLQQEQARLVDIQKARAAASVAALPSGEGVPPAKL